LISSNSSGYGSGSGSSKLMGIKILRLDFWPKEIWYSTLVKHGTLTELFGWKSKASEEEEEETDE